ncbi:MAG: ATP-binding protein [Chitinophagales bacterium]
MVQRELKGKIIALKEKFPILTLTGARQTGKTTLLKSIYSEVPYVSLEDIDNREFALNDPRGFLSNYPNGAVIDEIQNVPTIFSYLQTVVDSKDIHFAISGSQNFQLIEKITQSLAGRTASLKLLPFSYNELVVSGKFKFDRYEELIYNGGYPRIYDKNIAPIDFYSNYISTYIERDVRQIKNIENLNAFSNFMKLCAGRTGQLLNIQSLATDAGISPNTAKSWLSVLEASYVIYLFQPHYKNFNKRIVKSPKLYFYDTGLACNLLNLENSKQLETHYLKGGLFENFVINEFLKKRFNAGKKSNLYFWQSKTKKEIDILTEQADKLIPFEVKSSKTRNESFFENLQYWKKLNKLEDNNLLNVIYGGDENIKTSKGNYISWRNIFDLEV